MISAGVNFAFRNGSISQLVMDERNGGMFSVTSGGRLALAKAVLSKSKIRDLRRITISQEEDHIILHGRASSYYHKQLAQELIRCELPDVEVINKMQVEYTDDCAEQL
jgi:hypothetical protein